MPLPPEAVAKGLKKDQWGDLVNISAISNQVMLEAMKFIEKLQDDVEDLEARITALEP